MPGKDRIFPREIIEHSSQLYYFRYSVCNKCIYVSLILLFLVTIAALPLVQLNLYSSAPGIIAPIIQRQVLTTLTSGRIVYSGLQNNRYVRAGDTLLVIDNNGIDEQLRLCNIQIAEASIYLSDLDLLLHAEDFENRHQLQSDKYRQAQLQALLELKEFQIRYGRSKIEFNRYRHLFEREVVSVSEYEKIKLDCTISKSDMLQFRKQQQNIWQSEYIQIREHLDELVSKRRQLTKTKETFILIAPMNGHLLDVQPSSRGNTIITGTKLAEISPDTQLIADCYVRPKDIGLLRKELAVNFKLEAFDYNLWGTVGGKILEIGKDIEYREGIPVFKVRCKMDKSYLKMKNGIRGKIKKGMALSAQFQITKRTLWQLLYDKADQWINPTQSFQS